MHSPRREQFSTRVLLAIVSAIAVLMVPVSYYYRALEQRPHSFASSTLMIEPKHEFDTASVLELLVDKPQIRDLRPVSDGPDLAQWLGRHLQVRQVDAKVVEVLAYGRRNERLSSAELQSLMESTVDLMRAEAMKTQASVTVIGTENITSVQ